MKRKLLFSFLLLIAGCSQKMKNPTIEYQGERFLLTRDFSDFEEYKETENNLDPKEYGRIEAKILSVPISQEYVS